MKKNSRSIKSKSLVFILSLLNFLLGLGVAFCMFIHGFITPFFENVPVEKLTIIDHFFIKYILHSVTGSLYGLFISAIIILQFDESKAKLHKLMNSFAFIFSLAFLLNLWRLFTLHFN